VQIRRPDGIPDVLQQIKHGVLGLAAQYAAFGHAIPGIVEPTLEEYTHLGDAASKTDGKIYSASSGTSAKRRHLLRPARRPLGVHHPHHAAQLRSGGIAGRREPRARRLRRCAGDALPRHRAAGVERRAQPSAGHLPLVQHHRRRSRRCRGQGSRRTADHHQGRSHLPLAPEGTAAGHPEEFRSTRMDRRARAAVHGQVLQISLAAATAGFKSTQDAQLSKNPFGVPITTGTWGGSHQAAAFAVHMYFLHQAFPEIVGTDDTLRGFDYVLGRHPVSNVSYVSSVGTTSKLIAYGNNRADYTFIPGGMIPGVVIIQPDFPELKDAWPFLWYENEYVVDTATTFILAANAADSVTH
jgi:endoglucanase